MNFLAQSSLGMSEGVTALFTFVLGLLVVFFGMAVIILFLAIIGKVFNKLNGKTPTKKDVVVKTEEMNSCEVTDGIDEKTKVAIISAIYAYYQQEDNGGCEFVVRKINKKR